MSHKVSKEEFNSALRGALQDFPDISIKDEQQAYIERLVLDKKDVLGVLPTGFGKSLIYQLLPTPLEREVWRN